MEVFYSSDILYSLNVNQKNSHSDITSYIVESLNVIQSRFSYFRHRVEQIKKPNEDDLKQRGFSLMLRKTQEREENKKALHFHHPHVGYKQMKKTSSI